MSELDSKICITSVRATVQALAGIAASASIDAPNPLVTALGEKKLSGRCIDRALIYKPDAVALWLYQKYTDLFTAAALSSDLALPMRSVMPMGIVFALTLYTFLSLHTKEGAAPLLIKHPSPV